MITLNEMKRISLIISFICFFLTTLFAETRDSISVNNNIRMGNRAFGLGMGRSNHHISYLSPLLYSGPSYSFWSETIKSKSKNLYSLLNNHVYISNMMPTNESTEMNSYYDDFQYNICYDWNIVHNFHMLCGAYAGFEMGVDMLMSNSNNPIYVRANLDLLGLTLRPTLCVQTKRRLIKISDQFNFRMAGIVFSPTYTQLYYDLILDEYDRSEFFDFNSFSEKVSFSNKLMIELPLRKTTLRIGLLAERTKSMIHLIDNRTTAVQALIGFSYDYFHLKGRLSKSHLQEIMKQSTQFETVFE